VSVVENNVASEVTGVKIEAVVRVGSEFGVVGKGVFMADVHNKEDEVSVDCALGGMVVKIGDVVTGVVNGIGGGILFGGGDVVAGVVGGVDAIGDGILVGEVDVVAGVVGVVDANGNGILVGEVDVVARVVGVVDAIGNGILVGEVDVVAGVVGVVDAIGNGILVGEVDAVTGVVDDIDPINDVVAIKVDEDILVDDVVWDVAGGFGDIVAGDSEIDDSETDDTSRLKRIAAAGTKNVRKMTMNIVAVRETNGMVSAYSRL
jgi:hypothetical protein